MRSVDKLESEEEVNLAKKEVNNVNNVARVYLNFWCKAVLKRHGLGCYNFMGKFGCISNIVLIGSNVFIGCTFCHVGEENCT